uniref:RNA-dependent RNA polymerase n=1 Tax=Sclerotinia sclerotiorum mitovirus 11 TaxID=1435439 RepID=W0FY22_9VIRU|nr:RNA-dependent RNA polymerase [Sclerotinia sclerotiorum mitovirus 11]
MLRILSLLLNLDKSTTRKLHIILNDFMSILDKNGTKFLAQYWSECFRLIGQFISGVKINQTRIRVKKYKNGLPRILGNEFKQFVENQVYLLNSNEPISPLFRAIITIFSWNRGIGVKHEIKFNSVTNPHSGSIVSLDLSTIKQSLAKLSLDNCNLIKRLNKPTFFISNKSGTNSKLAFLSFGLDTIGFIRNPFILISYIKLAFKCKFYLLLITFIICIIICIPFSLLIIGHPIYLGRLSIIKELKGKARVIGITDQWTQWLLKPVHDALANILSEIPEDGTHNQLKPVKLMLELNNGSKEFNSLDLSNATDRLPVAFQADILSCLGFPGQEWMTLLNRPYNFEGNNLNYAVGQPMGAYSSFVMLALANHILVISSLPSYNKGSGQYAVLGDDVVIANDLVARSYHSIMVDILGVKINLSKTLVSEHSFEFAKRLVSKDVELTPLGASNALLALQSLNGVPSLLRDLSGKGVTFTEDSVDDLISRVPTVRKSQLETILWTIKGPFGFVPTRVGLASFLTMSSSLTPVRANQIIDAVRRVKHQFDVNTWKTAVRKAIEFQISISELYYPVGFSSYPSGFENSSVRRAIIHQNSLDLQSLGASAPRWRLVFGGPLIMMDYYRASYEQEIVAYIKELITDQSFEVSIGGGDPFVRQTFEDYAFSSRFKGKIFFDQVRETLRQRALPL